MSDIVDMLLDPKHFVSQLTQHQQSALLRGLIEHQKIKPLTKIMGARFDARLTDEDCFKVQSFDNMSRLYKKAGLKCDQDNLKRTFFCPRHCRFVLCL